MTDQVHDKSPRHWTPQQVRGLGVTTDLVTAGAILGIGRTNAYALAQADEFPVPLLRIGRSYRVPVAGLLAAVGLPIEPTPTVHSGPAA